MLKHLYWRPFGPHIHSNEDPFEVRKETIPMFDIEERKAAIKHDAEEKKEIMLEELRRHLEEIEVKTAEREEQHRRHDVGAVPHGLDVFRAVDAYPSALPVVALAPLLRHATPSLFATQFDQPTPTHFIPPHNLDVDESHWPFHNMDPDIFKRPHFTTHHYRLPKDFRGLSPSIFSLEVSQMQDDPNPHKHYSNRMRKHLHHPPYRTDYDMVCISPSVLWKPAFSSHFSHSQRPRQSKLGSKSGVADIEREIERIFDEFHLS